MDRERLKEVQQTDLTESRVNQDFVDWLKNKGPSYLLIILVVLLAFVGFNKFKEYKAQGLSNAFMDLDESTLPESYMRVAEEHDGKGSVAQLARLAAADYYYQRMLTRRDPNTFETLTEDQVDEARREARTLWERVLKDTANARNRVPHRIQALFGLATIDESGDEPDFDSARARYEEVKQIAGDMYPVLADTADARIAALDELRGFDDLPAQADLPVREFFDPLLEGVFEEHGLEPS